MKQANMKLIGSRIHEFRESKRLIRETFAEVVGISPQFLAEIETGKKGMSAETLYKICSQFQISADYILFGREQTASSNPFMENLKNLTEEELYYLIKIIQAYTQALHH